MKNQPPELIRAAGGLVWRLSDQGRELLLVHRPRYDDWSLPKGKLKPGERWQDAARREVAEETGLQVALGDLAGETFYYVDEQPKIVLFWHMTLFDTDHQNHLQAENTQEVNDFRWISVPEELDRLSYAVERDLVQEALKFNSGKGGQARKTG